MASSSYIKPYVINFQKKIRIYLNDFCGQRSFVSQRLLDRVCPDIDIEEDADGPYVLLGLAFGPHRYFFAFDVVDFDTYDIAMGKNHLNQYDLDDMSLYLDHGTVQVFHV